MKNFKCNNIEYAIRVIRVLLGGEMITCNEICRKSDIPFAYAKKVAAGLSRARIVEGTFGTHGGYRLLKPLSEITLYDVGEAVGGTFTFSFKSTRRQNSLCPCERAGNCAVLKRFGDLNSDFGNTLKEFTLESLLGNCLENQQEVRQIV